MNQAIRALADIPRCYARSRPTDPALLFEGRETRWAELDRRSSRIAQGLLAAGLEPGHHVAYLGKNSDAFFEILFGSAKLGSVFASLNWRLADEELAYVLDDAEARVVFVEDEFLHCVERVRDRLAHLKAVVTIGAPRPGSPSFEEWRDAQPDADLGRTPSPDAPILQLYTSGTTGKPKGARFPMRSLLDAMRIRQESGQDFARIEADDVHLSYLPLFHIGGAGLAFEHLYHGVAQLIMPQFEPGGVLLALERYRVRRLGLAPTMIQMLLEDPLCRPGCFERVEYVIYGGSPIGPELLRRALDTMRCDFVQQYGMTESTGLATYLGPSDHDPGGTERMSSAGRALPSVEREIRDSTGGRLSARETGEVCIRSPCLMSGYWKQPEATREAIRDGWLYTGDAGFLDEDGYLYIRDRVKDMIVSGAENIYPVEVENAIASHPEVRMVAVVAVPDTRWGETVKAVVVREPGARVTEREIIEHALLHVARYKRPRSVDFVDELPVTASGKILRRAVREPYWKGRDRRVG